MCVCVCVCACVKKHVCVLYASTFCFFSVYLNVFIAGLQSSYMCVCVCAFMKFEYKCMCEYLHVCV